LKERRTLSATWQQGFVMARICEICKKKTVFGHNISHAHNVTNRSWQPNLQRVRVRLAQGGTRRMRVCTRCLRSGKVQKAVS
jgi:large subunit ribosomal protein L28